MNGFVQQWTLRVVRLICLLCTIMASQPDLKPTPQEGIHGLSYKPGQRPTAGEVLGLR